MNKYKIQGLDIVGPNCLIPFPHYDLKESQGTRNELMKKICDFLNEDSGSREKRLIQLRSPDQSELGLVSVPATITDEQVETAHKAFCENNSGDGDEESFEDFCQRNYPDMKLERIIADEVTVSEDVI